MACSFRRWDIAVVVFNLGSRSHTIELQVVANSSDATLDQSLQDDRSSPQNQGSSFLATLGRTT